MTTSPRMIVSDDAFSPNDGIVFARPPTPTASLAVLTYVAQVMSNLRQERLDCLSLAIRRVAAVLPDDRLWLLACQAAWQPDTRRMRSLKLWRCLANGGMKTPARTLGAEIAKSDSRGLRWFAVAEVQEDELPLAHDIVSVEKTSFFVASPEPPVLEEYLAAGWAEGHEGIMTFWRDMALVTARVGNVLFRPFGNFDDAEVGVNLIGAPDTIALLKANHSA